MSIPRKLLVPALLTTLTGDLLAQATGAPDAGALRQQIEQQRELPLPSRGTGATRAEAPPEIKAPSGLTVTVRSFRFAGNTLLSSDRLAQAVQGFLGRPLGFADLQRAADAVAVAYRDAGWIVRVYLPEQEIGAGVVTLQVMEARFGGTRFEGPPSRRVLHPVLQAYFEAQQGRGEPLSSTALDRALLLADDLPGVNVTGTLVPGQANGETELALQVTDQPFVYGDVGVDNTGARATGSNRVSANLNVNSPGGQGELFSLSALHSKGSDYGRAAFTVPLGANGTRIGLNGSAMTYKVVEGPGANTSAQVSGRSGSVGLEASHPLVRARLGNLYLSAGADEKTFYTADTQVRSDYGSRTLRLGLSGNRFDDLGGGGANSASLQITTGKLVRMATHTLLPTIDRRFDKINYSVSRQQVVSATHSVQVSLTGQQATRVLDSSEKFYIGGAGSVRAYPSSELGGERGQVASVEWRWRAHPSVVLSAFADAGRVVALAPTPTDRDSTLRLNGRGVSALWQGPGGITARLTWSHRNGSHPKPTFTGSDGDGTLRKNRVWVTASVPF